jgi:hypothetical protein
VGHASQANLIELKNWDDVQEEGVTVNVGTKDWAVAKVINVPRISTYNDNHATEYEETRI